MCAGASQDWGKQRLHPWRAHARCHMHWDQGQSRDSIGARVRSACRPWRVYWGGKGWFMVGARTLVTELQNHHWHELSMRSPFWPQPTACRLQCWDASGLTTNRVGTQSHPSADKVPKVKPELMLLLNTSLDTEGQDPTPPTRKPASSWTNLTHQEADSRKMENYDPAA